MRILNEAALLGVLILLSALGVAAQQKTVTKADIDRLEAAAEATLAKISYRETITDVGYHDYRQKPYSTSVLVTEYQRPNRERMVYEETDENGTSRNETIDIGNREYSREGSGKWKVAKKKDTHDLDLVQTLVTDESKVTVKSEYLYLGEQNLNGAVSEVYQVTTTRILQSPNGEISNPTVVKYWFDKTRRLLEKQVETTDSVSRSLHRETTEYQYDVPIKIEAPIK